MSNLEHINLLPHYFSASEKNVFLWMEVQRTGFRWDLCALKSTEVLRSGVWKRRGPSSEEMALARAAVGSEDRLCSFPDFAPDSRWSSTPHH